MTGLATLEQIAQEAGESVQRVSGLALSIDEVRRQ
jgi:hypothetical protein